MDCDILRNARDTLPKRLGEGQPYNPKTGLFCLVGHIGRTKYEATTGPFQAFVDDMLARNKALYVELGFTGHRLVEAVRSKSEEDINVLLYAQSELVYEDSGHLFGVNDDSTPNWRVRKCRKLLDDILGECDG